MTRQARKISESGWYHVTSRGAGRRALFESDDDRTAFLDDMRSSLERSDGAVEIPVWCLMDNHIHLITKANDLSGLQKCLHRLFSGYAIRFNRKNGHIGPVFQERFASFPITSEEYLMEAIRYVHLNCRDKGISNTEYYPWSSYRTFMDDSRTPIMNDIIDIFGSFDEFKKFHEPNIDLGCIEYPVHRMRLTDDEARRIARIEYGPDFAETIPLMEKEKRDKAIMRLFALGLSTRQLERLTGIGRGVIRRVCGLR